MLKKLDPCFKVPNSNLSIKDTTPLSHIHDDRLKIVDSVVIFRQKILLFGHKYLFLNKKLYAFSYFWFLLEKVICHESSIMNELNKSKRLARITVRNGILL